MQFVSTRDWPLFAVHDAVGEGRHLGTYHLRSGNRHITFNTDPTNNKATGYRITTRVLVLVRNTPKPQRSNHPQASQTYPSSASYPTQTFFKCLLRLSLRITFLHPPHRPMTFRNLLSLMASSGWSLHTWRAMSLKSAPPLKVLQNGHFLGRVWLF